MRCTTLGVKLFINHVELNQILFKIVLARLIWQQREFLLNWKLVIWLFDMLKPCTKHKVNKPCQTMAGFVYLKFGTRFLHVLYQTLFGTLLFLT